MGKELKHTPTPMQSSQADIPPCSAFWLYLADSPLSFCSPPLCCSVPSRPVSVMLSGVVAISSPFFSPLRQGFSSLIRPKPSCYFVLNEHKLKIFRWNLISAADVPWSECVCIYMCACMYARECACISLCVRVCVCGRSHVSARSVCWTVAVVSSSTYDIAFGYCFLPTVFSSLTVQK